MSDIVRDLAAMDPHVSGDEEVYCCFCSALKVWNHGCLGPLLAFPNGPYEFTGHSPECLWYRACLEVAAMGLPEPIRVPPPQWWAPLEEP